VLAGNHDTAGTLGKLAQNMDATVSSRSSHGDPDPSGYIDAAISSRSDFDESTDKVYLADGAHGGASATLVLSDYASFKATGFSTHAAADVVTALLAAESYQAILSAAGYYKHEVTVLTRDATSGEVLTATHTLYDADGELLKTINYTGTVNAQGTLTAHKKEPQ